MYSSFHCLSFFELGTHYTPLRIFVKYKFYAIHLSTTVLIWHTSQKSNEKLYIFHRKKNGMLYLKYSIPFFLLVFPSFSIQKIRKVCQFFTLLHPMPQFLPLSDHNVQREYPRKYTAGAYLSPVPDHRHNTMCHQWSAHRTEYNH